MSNGIEPNQFEPALARPESKTDLFVTFTRLALQGFGGVLAVAQRELVERKRWLSRQDFVEMLALSQVLPGPNVVNLALMFGDRFFGVRGALAAVGGMIAVPLVIVMAMTALYAEFSHLPVVAGALRGMGAVAAGLIVSTGFKLMPALATNKLGLPLGRGPLRPHLRRHRLAALAAGLGHRRPRPCRRPDRLAAPAMSAFAHPVLSSADLLGLFAHFLVLSLLAVGGAITTAPDMHRFIVDEHHWITDAQFSASIAIAQAAPGPNVLFVAVLGWNVAGPIGALATMAGTMLPSTALTLVATRWGARRRETRGVRAFTAGLTPLTIGLLFATGWLLARPYLTDVAHTVGAVGLIAVSIVVMLRTKVSPMWLVGLGAVVGAFGWV